MLAGKAGEKAIEVGPSTIGEIAICCNTLWDGLADEVASIVNVSPGVAEAGITKVVGTPLAV
jgi:hypothetical protein